MVYARVKDGMNGVFVGTNLAYTAVERVNAEDCPEGFKPMTGDAAPKVEDGFKIECAFTDTEDSVVKTFRKTAVSIVHTYRVGDLFWWVYTKGKSEELDALLKARGLYTAAIAQTTVSDGDPNFTTILDSIASELGFTEEDIAEALKSAVV